ncbi:MAG TPA: serine hydrolase domain-containing protein [Flavitalea sp.]|nr:serine hydrolase domain-containing protein [Flavitalea sp.]
MKKITLFLLMATVFIHSLIAQSDKQRIDSLVNAYYENAEFNGTLLVARSGQIILNKGYGFSDVGNKILNSDKTVFNIASITKTFTAALILKLQEEGKLSVNDQLSKYYPDYPNGDKITIHQLLTHTAGVTDYVQDPGFQSSDQSKAVTLQNMIDLFKDKPLSFEPGTKFRYSNSGYTLLGYIIEKLTGTSYADALQQYIFRTLRMKHTTFGPPADTTNLAKGYMMYFKNFKRSSLPVHATVSYATGAIYSTVNDLNIWHRSLQSGKFLSAKSLKSSYLRDKGNYGFGWFTDTLYGKPRVSHDGNISGFKSNINRFPADDICVIALSNSNNSAVGGMVRNIVNIVYDQPFSKSIADQPVIDMSDSLKAIFAGVYRFGEAKNAQVSVDLVDKNLLLTIPGIDPMKLDPITGNVFRSGPARVEFWGPAKGQFTQIRVYNKGEFFGAQKVTRE